jgi:hypothetical protein
MTDAQSIAQRLRQTRLALGFKSYGEFIKGLPIRYNTYSGWESGHPRRRLTLEGALLLCQAHDISLDWLYFGKIGGLHASLADKLRHAT